MCSIFFVNPLIFAKNISSNLRYPVKGSERIIVAGIPISKRQSDSWSSHQGFQLAHFFPSLRPNFFILMLLFFFGGGGRKDQKRAGAPFRLCASISEILNPSLLEGYNGYQWYFYRYPYRQEMVRNSFLRSTVIFSV